MAVSVSSSMVRIIAMVVEAATETRQLADPVEEAKAFT
jgi:hypothetical protein